MRKPVFLTAEKCNGCVNCMKRCPTEAIRVRDGKAKITYERCVGCGECVKNCPTSAKKETYDPLSSISQYKYKVAVLSASAYGQFNNLTDTNYVLTGLKKIGFDDVYEASYGAEHISAATRKLLKEGGVQKPIISSACPAIANLILMRYENLIEHLSPLVTPELYTAYRAAEDSMKKTGLKREDIGIILITQCAAHSLTLGTPADRGNIDKILSFKEVYFPLVAEMNKLRPEDLEPLKKAGQLGVSWGTSTGEVRGIGVENYLSADGIENVMSVLNDLEHDKLNNLDFLELYACPSGCVGGSMNIENPFLARTRIRLLRRDTAPNTTEYDTSDVGLYNPEGYESHNVFKLDDNVVEAMKKMALVKEIYAKLPKMNCGSCGAPNCLAFAEDKAKGLKVRCRFTKGAGT